MAFKFTPSCNCCCTIFSDNFNRSDDTDLGTDWTESVGTAEISSNKLKVDTSSRVLTTTTHATPHRLGGTLLPPQHAVIITGHAAHGSKVWVIVDYLDSSNYHALEVETVDNDFFTIRLRKWTAGTPTTLATVAGNDQNGGTRTVQYICIIDSSITASVNDTVITAVTTDHGGDKVGLENGSDGNVRFDDFLWSKTSDTSASCPQCPAACFFHTPGTSSKRYLVTITGLVDDGCGCSAWNAAFVVTHIGGSIICEWLLADIDAGCYGAPVDMKLRVSGAVNIISIDGVEWFRESGLTFPRDGQATRSLPYTYAGAGCDGTGATCTVEPL